MTRIYEAKSSNYADLTVRVVSIPTMADLIVYRNDEAESEAHGEEIWTYVPNRENAHLCVYFTPRGMTFGHLTVAFTKNRRLAGWQRFHKLRGHLGNSYQRFAVEHVSGGRQHTAYWSG